MISWAADSSQMPPFTSIFWAVQMQSPQKVAGNVFGASDKTTVSPLSFSCVTVSQSKFQPFPKHFRRLIHLPLWYVSITLLLFD
jgi:hypothetical protein